MDKVNQKKPMASDIQNEKNKEKRDKLYNTYVKRVTPTHNRFLNIFRAFWVGGLICTIGQWITNMFTNGGTEKQLASYYTTIILVLLAVLLTGINAYQKLAKYAGAGSLVPITGFANSVAAPALEFSKEGQVFGVGCKIFTIAGPVILYGIFTSWVLGVIYWIYTLFAK